MKPKMLCKKIGQASYEFKSFKFVLNQFYYVFTFFCLMAITAAAQCPNIFGIPSTPYIPLAAAPYGMPFAGVAMPNQWQPATGADGTIGGLVRPGLGYTYVPAPWFARPAAVAIPIPIPVTPYTPNTPNVYSIGSYQGIGRP